MSEKYLKRIKKGKGRQIKNFRKKSKAFFEELNKDDTLRAIRVNLLKSILKDMESE